MNKDKKKGTAITKLKAFNLKKNYPMLILLVVGILLLLFSSIPTGDSVIKSNPTEESMEQTVDDYEKRLTELIAQVSGAGNVKVMVTMDTKGETIYAQAETTDEQTTTDSEDSSIKTGYSNEYIIVEDDNGNKTALIEKEYEPEIKGVAVLCDGGDITSVVAEVTELVQVVMGVPSNRVFVGRLTDNY